MGGEPLQVGMSFSDLRAKWYGALGNAPQEYRGASQYAVIGGGYPVEDGSISYTPGERGAGYTVTVARYRKTSQTSMFEEQSLDKDAYRYYSNEYKLVMPRIVMYDGYESTGFNYICNVYRDDNLNVVTEWAVDKNNNGIIDEGEIFNEEPNCRLDVEKNIDLEA